MFSCLSGWFVCVWMPVCACLFHWSAVKVMILSPCLGPLLSLLVTVCDRGCLSHLPHRAGALSVFLPCRLKCLCSAVCSCSILTLCGVNGKSQKAASLNRIAVRGRRVGTTAHLPPFNLLLCCWLRAWITCITHYFGIILFTAHALVSLVWFKYIREVVLRSLCVCVHVSYCIAYYVQSERWLW